MLQNVRYFDRRIQTIDPDSPELFNTRERKNVLVDSFVKWAWWTSSSFISRRAAMKPLVVSRLRQTINDGLRATGQKTVTDVISGQRDQVMESVRKRADLDARKIGVQLLDVRLKRWTSRRRSASRCMTACSPSAAPWPASNARKALPRLNASRADAERQRDIILAEAYRKAQAIRVRATPRRRHLRRGVWQKPEFYAFYRSMDAYKQTFRNKSDVLVLDPARSSSNT